MELWIQMLQHSCIGGIAIVVVCVFSGILKRKYSYRYKKYIWLFISLWLLIPCSIFQGSKRVVVQIPEIRIGQAENTVESLDENGILDETLTNEVVKQDHIKSTSNRLADNLIFCIWLLGTTILALYFIFSYIWIYRDMAQRSVKCNDEKMLSVLQVTATKYGINKQPRLYLLKGTDASPFTIGLFHKSIFLPDREYLQKDLQYILAHELVHCKERDTTIKILAILVNIIHWFNPFVWLMRRNLEQDIELNCDEIVLNKKTLEERKEYSEIIMSCIQVNRTRKLHFSSGYVNNTKFIKRRFQNIYNNKNKKHGYVFCICLVAFVIIGGSMIEIKQSLVMPFLTPIPIDSGIEIRTDIDGDGKSERVYVRDNISGTYAFTQLSTELYSEDDNTIFTDFEGYWSSYIISGDLSGNGVADIVLIRISTGSTYGGGVVSVLHLEDGKWIQYPSDFIENPAIKTEQPENFDEENYDVSCLGATIVEDLDGVRLRLILNEDIINDTVKCVDCTYQDNGWYIEDIEIIYNYYGEEKEKELLKNNFLE